MSKGSAGGSGAGRVIPSVGTGSSGNPVNKPHGVLPKITSAFINVTNACNLACKYCFVHQNPQYMDLQTGKDAVDFLYNNTLEEGGMAHINLFGGEPMLRYDGFVKPLIEYIKEKHQNDYGIGMTSNCTLMDEKRLEFLAMANVGLLFSIDGARESQDINRPCTDGSSSFDKLESIIPLVLQYFPDVPFRSTVTPATIGKLMDNVLFAEECGFHTMYITPNVFEDWDKYATAALQDGLRKYAEHYISSFRKGNRPIFLTPVEGMFKAISQRNRAIDNNIYREDMNCKSCGKCGMGASRYAAIATNGDVITCQEFLSHADYSKFLIGNIYEGIDDDKRRAIQDNFSAKSVVGLDCENCPLDRICNGGCIANNYMQTESFNRPDDIYCRFQQLCFENAVLIMRELSKDRNEAFRQRWYSNGGRAN